MDTGVTCDAAVTAVCTRVFLPWAHTWHRVLGPGVSTFTLGSLSRQIACLALEARLLVRVAQRVLRGVGLMRE